MFDDLLVLSEGRVLFQGPAGKVAKHFRSMGHAMPPNTNPGEFAIDVVSVDYTSKVRSFHGVVRASVISPAFCHPEFRLEFRGIDRSIPASRNPFMSSRCDASCVRA